VYSLIGRYHLSLLIAALPMLVLIKPDSAFAAEPIVDPMQPPAFALNKFRLAKLKKAGRVQSSQRKAVVKPEPLLLTSILIGADRRIAIINNKTMMVGDSIGSAKLVRILKGKVQLFRKGKRIELKLDNEFTVIRKKTAESQL